MKISKDKLQSMYDLVDVNKKTLHNALKEMGKKHLKTKIMKDKWTPDNPTKNYCYVIAEFVYYYLSPVGSKPYKLPNIPGDDGLHRFVKWPDGTIVDLAVDQFDNYEDVDYSKSSVCYFLQTGVKGPSKRTRILAELCGYNEVPNKKEMGDRFWK